MEEDRGSSGVYDRKCSEIGSENKTSGVRLERLSKW